MPVRLFVAVWPSVAVVEALAALERPALDGVRWTRPDQWHVTLRFLGEVGEEVVPVLEHVLGDLAAAAPSRVATVGPETASFGRRVLMLPVAGLDDLGVGARAATASFGAAPDDRPFAGHLTLARADRERRGRSGGDIRRLVGVPFEAQWRVGEITLVRSTTGRSGASYDVLRRFPLA